MPDWLLFIFFLEMGYLPAGGVSTYESDYVTDHVDVSQTFYTELGFEVHASVFFIGGGVKMYVWPIELTIWSPHRMAFWVYGGLSLDWFEIGARHMCVHPVIPNLPRALPIRSGIDEAYTELYVRLTAKVGGKE